MNDNSKIFDRVLYRKRRNRAAAHWSQYDFLKREAAERLTQCMDNITRSFPLALELGCHAGELQEALRGSGKIETLIRCDLAEGFTPQIVWDEEFLPFTDNSFDCIVSTLSLHHVNDLPGTLLQIRRCLKPDGLFIGIVPGASSLSELRASVTGVSAEHGFPMSPRLSPLVEIRDAGALLQRAGFVLPVADSDTLVVHYDDAMKLMRDLRGMGENNVLLTRQRNFTTCSHITAIAEYYHAHFALPGGVIPASFEFITMTGWKAEKK